MLNDLEKKAIETGLDVLFKQIVEGLRTRRFWQRNRATRFVHPVGAKLDDLVLDLQPCFDVGKHTSIYEVFHLMRSTQDELWNQTHYLLHVIGMWFSSWDRMRVAIGTRRTPEILAEQLESLNWILIAMELVAQDLSKRFARLTPDDHARMPYKAVADRYNLFVTNYESLLRRLPQDVGLVGPSPLGKERIFVRLQ
jgi:hypothetical protein